MLFVEIEERTLSSANKGRYVYGCKLFGKGTASPYRRCQALLCGWHCDILVTTGAVALVFLNGNRPAVFVEIACTWKSFLAFADMHASDPRFVDFCSVLCVLRVRRSNLQSHEWITSFPALLQSYGTKKRCIYDNSIPFGKVLPARNTQHRLLILSWNCLPGRYIS